MTHRSTALVLLGLGAALVLLPLGLGLPGLPMSLRADETSHYFLACSLAHDGDSVADATDVDRIFRDMPYTGRARLALGSDDGWQTARWAVSPLYSTLLVPVVAMARTNGAFAFNALCFVFALVLLGRSLIERFEAGGDTSLAWVVAGTALFLSGAFVYVWWIHPASLRLLLVSAALCLGWRNEVDSATYSSLRSGLRMAAAGACLGLCVAEVPWLAVLVPPLLARHRGSLRRSAALLAGALAGAGFALWVGWMVLGHSGPSAFSERAVFEVDSPDHLPWKALEQTPEPAAVDGLRPVPGPRTTAERLLLSLVGRRRGLLLLFPFAALFVAAAFRQRGNDLPSRALLAAGLAALVLSRPFADPTSLDLERFGDPVLAAAWPAFFFLPVALPGALATLATVAVSALLLMPTILTPFGPPVPFGDAHHAGRGGPTQRLPTAIEEISEAAGWVVYDLGGPPDESLRLWAPAHATKRYADAVALLGGERVELWIESRRPVAGLHLDLRSFAPGNRVTFDLAAGRQRYTFAGRSPPDQTRIRLPLENSWRPARRTDGVEVWITRVVATTTSGESPEWRTDLAELYFVGALLTVLGSDEQVARDVWSVRWGACGAPPTAQPGESLLILARLRNTSTADWFTDGPVRVRLAHRWRHRDGGLVESALRTDFDHIVRPGEEVLTWVTVEAPAEPGAWQLEIEPVYEFVGWFSDHLDDEEDTSAVCRAEILVEGS